MYTKSPQLNKILPQQCEHRIMPLSTGRDAQALSDNPVNVRGDNPEGLEDSSGMKP
jgi:hypothetical protein